MFQIGLVALAVGLVFDWQGLFPAIGDRIAALCALTVGAAWLAHGQVGGWVAKATTKTTSVIGQSGHTVTTDIPVSGGRMVLGIVVGFLFLMWLLAMLPAHAVLKKWVAEKVSNKLSSGLIWSGVLFAPVISLVPGWWGEVATRVTFAGADLGAHLSGLALS